MCNCSQPTNHSSPETQPSSNTIWRPDDGAIPAPAAPNSTGVYRPDVLKTIEAEINRLDEELRELSLDIHAHPELAYKEIYAHDTYTAFLEKHGFEVTRHYHLQTAWKATFSHGDSKNARTIGINSEMDALPQIGHACGHNLIGMSGVAVACAIKAALEVHDISGTICLLGTPAEEGGSGKVKLLEKGAYEQMDICLMCHPAPGPVGAISLPSCLSLQRLLVEYKGHTAHAALSPWEGRNAQDAAVLGYMGISALRQQLDPSHRVHGVISAGDHPWVANVIPDYAAFKCIIRAPTAKEVAQTTERVKNCVKAAGMAAGCEVVITDEGADWDLRQNPVLSAELENIFVNKYGSVARDHGLASASTDFGNVTYALPAIHPGYAIPSLPNGGNHTAAFTAMGARLDAHYITLDVSKALAATGIRVLMDDQFFADVQQAFDEDKLARLQG